jgi:hypothetical protein
MKLSADGVTFSILILIFMILICHTMNYLYPKNLYPKIKFENIPEATNYNEIYYSNKSPNQICDTLSQAEIPCTTIPKCNSKGQPIPTPTPTPSPASLASLSDSEIAVLYKVAYETSARELFMRTLEELSTPKPT